MADKIEDAVKQVYTVVDKIVQSIVIQIDTNLVLATPVDTGRARSNWQISTGNQATSVRVPTTASAAIQAAKATAATIPSIENPSTAYITNNVHYIRLLNQGRSRQAPPGFVEANIILAVNSVRSKFRV